MQFLGETDIKMSFYHITKIYNLFDNINFELEIKYYGPAYQWIKLSKKIVKNYTICCFIDALYRSSFLFAFDFAFQQFCRSIRHR